MKNESAKSKPMMNLVSQCSERTLDVLPSVASESPVKTRHESQFPLSPQTEQHYRTGRPVAYAYSSSFSECETWSSQEWKSDELMEDRTGQPHSTRTDSLLKTTISQTICVPSKIQKIFLTLKQIDISEK